MIDYKRFQWINPGNMRLEAGKLIIDAPAKTDFFCGGEDLSEEGIIPVSLCNAPYLYTEVEGDFVLTVKVSHAFKDTYDSATVMVMKDMKNWAKACFELTDFGTHAAVSVVTKNGESDDANGCNISGQDYAWLRVCRVGNEFGFQYSADGVHFYMTRDFRLSVEKTVKVGFMAQAPQGGGGERVYEDIRMEHKTVKNVRNGE